MSHKTFVMVSGLIFSVVGVLHLLRILYGWDVVMGTYTVPMWASWIALPVALLLAYTGLRLAKR